MPNVFVEKDKKQGDFKAMQNGRVITRGETQKDTGDLAHKLRPSDTILAERQRETSKGSPDKWRHLYGPQK
jgi:hypothetical protein